MVGKAEKSSGRSMNSVTVNIRIASAKDSARPRSSTQAGMGRTIIMITAISASASRIVGWKSDAVLSCNFGMSGHRRKQGNAAICYRDQ